MLQEVPFDDAYYSIQQILWIDTLGYRAANCLTDEPFHTIDVDKSALIVCQTGGKTCINKLKKFNPSSA
jgi:hypothetical protein